MIIRKKLVNKYYSEKLYSTGNDNLDSLLEKAFCDGYEYAQREFSDDIDDEDIKLEKQDERDIKFWKRHKKTADLKRRAYEGDDEAKKTLGKRGFRASMATGAGFGAISGAAIGAGSTSASTKRKLRNAAIGAGIGAAAGTGMGALLGREIKKGWAHNDKYDERDPSIKKQQELEHDKIAVATEKMSRKDFLKKWGK